MIEFPAIPEVQFAIPIEETRIIESGEPLRKLHSRGRLITRPAYVTMGYTTATACLQIREGVLAALECAAETLPVGMTLVVWDALRSLATQAEIVDRARRDLGMLDPSLDLSRYVSPLPNSPKEFQDNPPPHASGGAVDLTLGDQHGDPLDLGCEFDEFGESASLTYFEQGDTLSGDDRRDLRRTLYWTMRRAGFAPFPSEFWHFERSTRRAAAFHGSRTASYGPAVAWVEPRRTACI